MNELFAHLCGQGRCFFADGAPLPVCQRCTGLYAGALITAIWIIAGRVYRHGIPRLWPAVVQATALGLAMAGGLHLLDPGPRWRFACGLWTGHVGVAWLTAAIVTLWPRRAPLPPERQWPRGLVAQGMVFPVMLGLWAMVFPPPLGVSHGAWTGIISLGAVAVGVTLCMTAGVMILVVMRWIGARPAMSHTSSV